jgi:hypothetical protein
MGLGLLPRRRVAAFVPVWGASLKHDCLWRVKPRLTPPKALWYGSRDTREAAWACLGVRGPPVYFRPGRPAQGVVHRHA